MKTEELKKVLTVMVRNEIKSFLKEEVRRIVAEEVNRAMGKVLVEMVKEIKINKPQQEIITEEKDVSDGIKKIISTKNPKLSQALEETARSRPVNRQATRNLADSLSELMDGSFEKAQNEDLGMETPQPPKTNMEFLKQVVMESAVPQTPSILDARASDMPDSLKGVFKAIKKDFRSTMKKMDEIKKNGAQPFSSQLSFEEAGE
jgi:hypothetical protein